MTWFEAEEFAKYVFGLEAALDEWRYNNLQMRAELAELARVERKMWAAIDPKSQDRVFAVLADEVLLRAKRCREEIQERLMA
jgi:hypothetical protein